MPFILRGVSLLGISAAATPRDLRLAIWKRLATDLRVRQLDLIMNRILPFDELPQAFEGYLKGQVLGRTVVQIAPSG